LLVEKLGQYPFWSMASYIEMHYTGASNFKNSNVNTRKGVASYSGTKMKFHATEKYPCGD
jgi:hypothetical protein